MSKSFLAICTYAYINLAIFVCCKVNERAIEVIDTYSPINNDISSGRVAAIFCNTYHP